MRENVIAATKGHIVHFFLTGGERERGGSVRQFGKRWRGRAREGETAKKGEREREGGREGGQRKIGGEEEKTTVWASRIQSVCYTKTQNHTRLHYMAKSMWTRHHYRCIRRCPLS